MSGPKAEAASQTLLKRMDAEPQRIAPKLSEVRRHIHQHPELSGQEFATTAYVSQELTAGGVPHEVAPDKRGIITKIISSEVPDSPGVAIRAAIDAFPLQEENEVPYRSQNPAIRP